MTEPDTIRNYELGFKSRLADGRFNLNVAAYRLEWKDIPGNVQFPCAFSNLVTAGDATGDGVEFEMVGRLSDAWKVNLAASYNDLTYDDNVRPAIGVSGDRVVGSPAKNYSAGLEYGFDLTERWGGWARADWAYMGSLRSELSSLPIDSYDTVNVRLGLVQDNLSIELFGRNITDEQGVTRIEPLAFGGDYVLIRPREVGIEVRYSYK